MASLSNTRSFCLEILEEDWSWRLFIFVEARLVEFSSSVLLRRSMKRISCSISSCSLTSNFKECSKQTKSGKELK